MEHNEDDDDEMGDEASDHVSTESVLVSEIYSLNNSALKETWGKTLLPPDNVLLLQRPIGSC